MAEMKDSGTAWLGMIPKDWELSKISSIYELRTQKVSDKDYPPLSVTMNGIVPQLDSAAKTNAHDDRKLVKKGDFAINSRSDRRGSCGVSEYDGSVSLINTVMKPRDEMNPDYYNWLFHTIQFADEFYKWGHGIVDDLWTTNWQDMKHIDIPVPTLDEQKVIADYLNKAIPEIDALHTDIEKQIETLEEYKKSIITEAVTKGLDPDVEMEDSGIEWIGMIPKEWECKKIKYVTNLARGIFGHRPRNDPRYYDGKYPFIQTGDVACATKVITNYSQTLNELGKKVSKEFKKGTIALTIAANVGDVSILGFNAYFPDSIMAIIPHKEIDNMYFYYILSIMKSEFLRVAIINTQLNLNVERVGNLYIPITFDKNKQKEIVKYLDEKCSEIDGAIEEKKEQLDTLEQYKKSLIYEYVTGKKEVQ